MNWQGWIFMLLSWSVAIGIFIFCMRRTLQPRPNNNNAQPTEPQQPGQSPQSEGSSEPPAQQ